MILWLILVAASIVGVLAFIALLMCDRTPFEECSLEEHAEEVADRLEREAQASLRRAVERRDGCPACKGER